MRKQRLTFFTLGVGVLVLLVVFFFASAGVRRNGHVTLPGQSMDPMGGEGGFTDSGSDLPLLEITPETVQQAIATLDRPESYARSVSVTTYWNGGSATDVLETAVSGEITRIDAPASGGSIRHLLTNGVNTAVWYDEEETYRLFASDGVSSDREQRIPSYEDILALDVEEIAVAVYGEYEGIYCISVLTAADSWGYHTAYWIGLDSGLLVAAEIFQGEELVYRMTALSLSVTEDEKIFLLPDGSELSRERPEQPSDQPSPPPKLPEENVTQRPPSQVASPSDMVLG